MIGGLIDRIPARRYLDPFGLLPAAANYDVCGKVALITGARQGIGFELAKVLLARGAMVALVDIDADGVVEAATELGSRAYGIDADVRDRAAMVAAVARAVEHFGKLDVVVANAGVVPKMATVRTLDAADFDRVIGVNLTGAFNTVRPALDHIVAANGHVVVVSSGAALTPGPTGSPYMISKVAVEQLGRALRIELAANGASAGVAYFGVVDTSMTHDTIDGDELGNQIADMLPWPLNVRISPAHAARVVADGIASRAPRTIAPAGWQPYALLRGLVNVALDSRMSRDRAVHQLVHAVERRARS